MQAITSWFPHETWVAMTMAILASAFDLILTLVLIGVGRRPGPFDWRRLPQFLVVNFLPLALGALLGAVAVKANPELGTDYLAVVGAATAIMNRGVRDKLRQLIGIPADGGLTTALPSPAAQAAPSVQDTKDMAQAVPPALTDQAKSKSPSA